MPAGKKHKVNGEIEETQWGNENTDKLFWFPRAEKTVYNEHYH